MTRNGQGEGGTWEVEAARVGVGSVVAGAGEQRGEGRGPGSMVAEGCGMCGSRISDTPIQKKGEGCALLSLRFLVHGQGKEGEDDETGLSRRGD